MHNRTITEERALMMQRRFAIEKPMKPINGEEGLPKYQCPKNVMKQINKDIEYKMFMSYCALNGWIPYYKSNRKRDELPQEEQLTKIALAQQKRERKELKKQNKI